MSDRSQDRHDPSSPTDKAADPQPGAEPRKAHGDGLLEGNGSRQGEDPGKRNSEERVSDSTAPDPADR